MAQPRFLFTSRVAPTPDGGTGVAWRLVGGNNHELGRSFVAFADADACRAAVHVLKRSVHLLVPEVLTVVGPAQWGWSLALDGETVAVSCRWYRREREGAYNLTQFLAAVPTAALSDLVTGLTPRRELLRPEFVLPHLEAVEALDEALTQDLPVDVVDEVDGLEDHDRMDGLGEVAAS